MKDKKLTTFSPSWQGTNKRLSEDSGTHFLDALIFIAPACSRVRYRRPIFRPSVRLSVRQSVRPSVRPSVNIYVDVRLLCQSKYSNQLQD